MKTAFLVAVLFSIVASAASAQKPEYVSPVTPAQTGKAPGMQVKLLSDNAGRQSYAVIFQTGDEVVSGLTEFAQRYNVKSAFYQGIGDAGSAKVGWYDAGRKTFKVIPIGPSEITSLLGDIAVFDGKQVAHTHINLSTEDGISHGGHLLELIVGPTLEVFVTVEQTPLFKRLKPEFNAGVIDPALDR
jgi:predicted DNA-binding protein with PD1-like motif